MKKPLLSILFIGSFITLFAEDISTSTRRYDYTEWRGIPPQESFLFTNCSTYPEKSFEPGAYGKIKDAPMFICYREFDGEIRLAGVDKNFSSRCCLPAQYFTVEIIGIGSANGEHIVCAPDKIIIGTNFTGVIQFGTNIITFNKTQAIH